MAYCGPFGAEYIPELKELVDQHETSPLYRLVDRWLRAEQDQYRHEKEAEAGELARIEANELLNAQYRGGGYTSGRMYTDTR